MEHNLSSSADDGRAAVIPPPGPGNAAGRGPCAQAAAAPTVFVVDDDEAVRHCLSVMLQMAGLHSETFADGVQFTRSYRSGRPGCLVLDARMPAMSGIEVQQWMGRQETPLPVIIITGHGEVSMAVTAFRAGAFDFLEKPFDDGYFISRVQAALAQDDERRRRCREKHAIRERVDSLSRRERDVMELMVKGLSNKLIANRLDIGVRTVETHRAQVMRKMDVGSLSELTRLHMCLHDDD
ncbi:MAG: response regulator transcription factor [Rhodospirillales bacterium]|nr:response regulator transcription factor [Rhodospirillales bacterium]